jgi:hypothetical protein
MPVAQAATAPALIEPFPVRARRLSQRDIEGLASALLDLCSAYEGALRTVISMQRNLERVRHSDELSPEASLLLQEVSRQLAGLRDGETILGDRLRTAGRQLVAVIGDS